MAALGQAAFVYAGDISRGRTRFTQQRESILAAGITFAETGAVTRLQASAIVLVLWAAIYLPGLGSTEIKGEEGRRILPAVTMLETGNWLVPFVGGKPFLRKPPLINWLIAGSFKFTGVRNEWTARMPSALCVLVLAGALVAVFPAGHSERSGAQRNEVEEPRVIPAMSSGAEATSSDVSRGPSTALAGARFAQDDSGGLVAAIFAMTSFGLLAKARFAGAEIEGVYAPLTGIAIVLWFGWWRQRRSPWLTWTVPFVFLGLASLTKGPSLHLLFFNAIVVAALWAARAWRWLWHPAHFAGLAISAAIFAAWAVPYFRSPEAKEAAAIWKRQGIDRFTDSEFNTKNYVLNIPRGLADQLPWLLLAPVLLAFRKRGHPERSERERVESKEPAELPATSPDVSRGSSTALRSARNDSDGDYRFFNGALFAVAVCFCAVLLVPGALPRYVLPLGVPFALLLAMALQKSPENGRTLRHWHRVNVALGGLLIVVAVAAPLFASARLDAPDFRSALAGMSLPLALRGALVASLSIAICAFIVARRPVALRPVQLAISSGALLGVGSILYATAAVRWINRADDLRPLAAQIDAAIPPGKRLVLYDPGYMPAIFYLRTPHQYAPYLEDIPADAEFVLARGQAAKKFAEKRPDLVVKQNFSRKSQQQFLLLQQREPISKDARPGVVDAPQ